MKLSATYRGHAEEVEGLAEALDELWSDELGEMGNEYVKVLRKYTPGGPDGNLARGYFVRDNRVYNDREYFWYVWLGRGAVRPVNKKALHWKVRGKDVFSMYSGPVAPNPFVERARAEAQAMLHKRLDKFANKTLDRAG